MTLDERIAEMIERCGAVVDIRQLEDAPQDRVGAAVAIVLAGEDGRTMLMEVGLSALGIAQATLRVVGVDDETIPPTLFESPDGSVLLSA